MQSMPRRNLIRQQPRGHLRRIGRRKHCVVLVRQRATARHHGTRFVVSHRLELPHRPHALEVAHVRAQVRAQGCSVCEVHAVDVGVDRLQRERAGRRGGLTWVHFMKVAKLLKFVQ